MIKSDNIKSGLMLAGVAVGGYLAWKAYQKGAGAVNSVSQFVTNIQQVAAQTVADVQSGIANNITGPFQRGQDYVNGVTPFVSSKAFLYSDAGYTGNDPMTGLPVISGEWYGDDEARRYTAKQLAIGSAPAATSINGAAFGIYPSAFRDPLSPAAAAAARAYFAAGDLRRLDN